MSIDLLSIIIIVLIIIVSYRIYYTSDIFQLKCIISDVDGERYCVRERNKLSLAADKLANVNKNMKLVVEYCSKNYPNNENIIRLKNRFNPKKIMETLPTSEYTAYSENKGEKLAFCLDKEKNDPGKLIDINTLTFVALHELAHVASESIGHTPEFWQNFKFLLIQAEKLNIYNPVDYKNNPQNYCGMTITDNPYYDVK
uniref:WLM domain-containing protein n=1 Tax=viral metagenome TaxID=1070528 RepID=A0A6C0AZJ3_9ZZZZ|tara:strand:+ start:22 stop:618 length:597 start_codon:yes stop_codon:yes gene_type:complete